MRPTYGDRRTQERRHLRTGFTRCSKGRRRHHKDIERRSHEVNPWGIITQPRRWAAPSWKLGSHSWRAHPRDHGGPHSRLFYQAVESDRLPIAVRSDFVRVNDAVSVRLGTARATGCGVQHAMVPQEILSMGMGFAPGSGRVVRKRRHVLADEEPWFS